MPLHLVFEKQLAPERLQAALSSVRAVGSLTLHDSVTKLPPDTPSLLVSALAETSASTLTALHGLPLLKPDWEPEPDLTPFTALRALTLRQTLESPELLRAANLPASLEEMTLLLSAPVMKVFADPFASCPPLFVGFERLRNLRRITIENYFFWELSSWDDEAQSDGPAMFPPSLEVRTAVPLSALCASPFPVPMHCRTGQYARAMS